MVLEYFLHLNFEIQHLLLCGPRYSYNYIILFTLEDMKAMALGKYNVRAACTKGKLAFKFVCFFRDLAS